MKPSCDRRWEVDALRDGRLADSDAVSFKRHRGLCQECNRAFREQERLRELGRAMAVPKTDEFRARQLRARILRTAATAGRSQLPLARALVLAGVCFAILLTLVVFRIRNRATDGRTTDSTAAVDSMVSGSADAIWSRAVDGRTERVRVERGVVFLHVRHRAADERFLVDLPDGQLEVRGTRFKVSVAGGRTESVHVIEGMVAVRMNGHVEKVLGAAESWPLASGDEPLAQTAPSTSAVAAHTAPAASPASAPPTVRRASRDTSYEEALELSRAKHYDEAAKKFHAFAEAHPNVAEAEDARFLEVSSLARAGRVDAAAAVAEAFLERHPSSIHRRDAAIVIVRALRARGECDKARTIVTEWIAGASDEEQRSLLAGCAK